MTLHLTNNREGFPQGLTWVTTLDEPEHNTGIAFAVLKLQEGQAWQTTLQHEGAFLLMSGRVKAKVDGEEYILERTSLFDESSTCIHAPNGTTLEFTAVEDTEFTLYQVDNTDIFPSKVYLPTEVPNEHRGKGQVGDTCLRLVRTIFDRTNAPEKAQLVLGEVVTLPGRWSSYPPHHHPQPEIYHYRFTKPQGFGHAELGDDVYKVKQYDTVKIFDGNDHAQCSAPGYGMYYAWVIRHLPDNPYTIPDFTEEHIWTTKAKPKDVWHPKELT